VKVIIAGSRRLPRGEAPRLLISILSALFDVDTVLLRGRASMTAGQFERDIANLCDFLSQPFEWCRPEPSEENPGRVSVYIRDMEMVEQCDLAILFFSPGDAEDGYSGTYHLLDKCLDIGRPVHAYTVNDKGEVARFGDYDPDHQFDHLALDTRVRIET